MKDEQHHPYCYAMATRCTACNEIIEIQYFDHVDGTHTPKDVATVDVCRRVEVSCAECAHVIRWYNTSHTPADPVEELDESGNPVIITRCAACGCLISSKPRE